MMPLIGVLMLLGCAEWALIFCTWVSFRYLLLYAGIGFLRLYYLFNYFPHWDAHYFIFPACILAVMQHLRSLFRASTSHNQQTYNTPETGVPWLVIIAQNRKRALFLEYAVMMLFVWYMVNFGRIVYGPKFLTLSPAWQTWFVNPSNASTFTLLLGVATVFVYGLWNVAVSGVPFFRPREAPAGESPYRHVREESHRLPRLPGVKDLSDNLGDFYS